MRRYPRHRLTLLAGTSAIVFVVALLGYLGDFFFGAFENKFPHRSIVITAKSGTVTLAYQSWISEDDFPHRKAALVYYDWRFDPAKIRRSLFDLGVETGIQEGVANYKVFRFPVWCVLFACSIAPILWLKKRRRLRTRGFAIEPAANAEAPRSR